MFWQNLLFEKMHIAHEIKKKEYYGFRRHKNRTADTKELKTMKIKVKIAEIISVLLVSVLTTLYIIGTAIYVSQADLLSQHSRLYGGLYYILILIVAAFAYNLLIFIGKFIIKEKKY